MRKSKSENLARRAEIGAERRARSRLQILRASVELFGNEAGRGVRLEDICKGAGISRGTFYNHFNSLDEFAQTLSEELSREFNTSVNAAFAQLELPAEHSAAALRYYLHAAYRAPEWGWAIVNTVTGPTLFGPGVFSSAARVIQTGIDSGEFDLENAELGRDILLGAAFTAMQRLLLGTAEDDYPETVAFRVLRAFGMPRHAAWEIAHRSLPAPPRPAESDQVIVPMPDLEMRGDAAARP